MAITQELIDFIVGPQIPIGTTWYDRTQVERGLFHGRNFPALPPSSTDPALDPYIQNNYYDLGLAMKVAYKRTGNEEFQTLFRKIADSWWKSPHIKEGTVRTFDTFTHTPRNASLGGLILRALDGRPEMWDYLNSYTRAQFDNWVKSRINRCSQCGKPEMDTVHGTGSNQHVFQYQLYLGIRDGAFMLQYAAWLAKSLPDSFPLQSGGTANNGAVLRSEYLADIELAATQYFGRLQYTDGSWRWDDPYYVHPEDGGTLKGVMQPFMLGLLMDALIDVYDVTSNATVKTSIINQVTKACRHIYLDGPYSTQYIPIFNANLRGFHYFYHGGTSVNPTRYAKGDLPADFADWKPEWDIQNQRQPIGLLVAAYGWSYKQTGDPFFKAAGDELWDSAYGDTDGIHNYMAGDAKSYNQNCRWAASYLVWAGQPAVPSPTPTPVPEPTPTPSIPTSPSPDGTKGIKIVDSQLAVWTIGPQSQTLRDGIQVGGGQGTEYKYLNGIVYVLGDIAASVRNWYKWEGTWLSVGTIEPGTTPTPTPTPTPVPEPVSCVLVAPTSVNASKKSSQTISVEVLDVKTPTVIKALSLSGQITVQPLSRTVSPESPRAQFTISVKQNSGSVKFDSVCGSKTVQVIVR